MRVHAGHDHELCPNAVCSNSASPWHHSKKTLRIGKHLATGGSNLCNAGLAGLSIGDDTAKWMLAASAFSPKGGRGRHPDAVCAILFARMLTEDPFFRRDRPTEPASSAKRTLGPPQDCRQTHHTDPWTASGQVHGGGVSRLTLALHEPGSPDPKRTPRQQWAVSVNSEHDDQHPTMQVAAENDGQQCQQVQGREIAGAPAPLRSRAGSQQWPPRRPSGCNQD